MIAIAVFLGSFLLFGIQPMLGRLLLPGFGGSATVWSVCLAAYQMLLLGGYLYAHAMAGVARQKQWRWHGAALALAGVWSLLVAWGWQGVYSKIGNSALPGLEVLGWVVVFAGVPYVVLASGSSLLQSWQARREGRGVYRLYAVSNLGSFLGLFCYPLVVEPRVSLGAQWLGFGVAFCAYGLLVGWIGWKGRNEEKEAGNRGEAGSMETAGDARGALPGALSHPVWWCVLPGLSSFLLVAVTNHLTQDVTPIPLIWVVLLGLFLLSYVAGFSRLGEKGLYVWGLLAVGAAGLAAFLSGMKGRSDHMFFTLLIWGGVAFFLFCIFLHSWLYAARPGGPKALTRFYLCVAAGGAVGGVSASLVFPMLFATVIEWPLGVLLVNGCLLWFAWKSRRLDIHKARVAMAALCCIPVWLAYNVHSKKTASDKEIVKAMRNFYGTVSVARYNATREGERRQDHFMFMHGQTTHGSQNRRYWDGDEAALAENSAGSAPDAKWRGFPLISVARKKYEEEVRPNMYFGPSGGGAGILSRLEKDPGMRLRVGVVGLGVGTLAAWGRPGDFFRFYEINPQVAEVALDDRHFNYLTGSKADVEIVLGDARKILEAEDAAGFEGWDVLYIDAYNSVSVPLHLATREAFALYRKRLAKDGILVVQMTNWHLNLQPLAKSAALETGMALRGIAGQAYQDFTPSMWAFLAEDEFDLVGEPRSGFEIEWEAVKPMAFPPTDHQGSLVSLIIHYGSKPEYAFRRLREPQQRPDF